MRPSVSRPGETRRGRRGAGKPGSPSRVCAPILTTTPGRDRLTSGRAFHKRGAIEPGKLQTCRHISNEKRPDVPSAPGGLAVSRVVGDEIAGPSFAAFT